MTVSKIALGWNAPFTSLAVRRLVALAGTGGIADFSGLLILAPTAESCRLLREALAAALSGMGRGAVGLAVIQPEGLIAPRNAASELQVVVNWMGVLADLPAAQRGELFKNADLESPNVLAGIAAAVQQCRVELCGEGLSLRDVYAELSRDGKFNYTCTRDNFEILAELERRYLKKFSPEAPDPVAASLAEIASPSIPNAVGKVIAIGCLELKLGVIAALENSGREVECWLPVPERELEHFDDYGRPEPDYWCGRELKIDLKNDVRCYSKPVDQARKLIEALRDGEECSVIGILDDEVTHSLLDMSEREVGIRRFFVPLRRPLAELPFTGLFMLLFPLTTPDPDFEAIARLARHSLVQNHLSANGVDIYNLLSALDLEQHDRLCRRLSDVRGGGNAGELARYVEIIEGWRRTLDAAGGGAPGLWRVFSEILRSSAGDPVLNDHLFELEELKIPVAAACRLNAPTDVILEALRRTLLRREVTGAGNLDGRPEIAGFMELLWRTEPRLTVAGFNEESFNYGDGSGAFLPDELKRHFHMQTARNRYAADSARFAALLERCDELKLMYGKSTAAGDVLRPSRLLLRREAEALPGVVAELFSGRLDERVPEYSGDGAGKFPPYMPRKVPMTGVQTMYVTGFRDYLECPFNFYVNRVLKAEELNDRNVELAPAQWGNAIHCVARRFVEQFMDGGRAFRGVDELLDEYLGRVFGRGHLGVVEIQRELMKSSLRSFAAKQDELAADGWTPVALERKMDVGWEEVFHGRFPGAARENWRSNLRLVGTVDRVDVNPEQNKILVLDYKTAAKAKTPESDHWSASGEDWSEVRGGATGKRVRHWKNLQLPLYVAMLEHLAPDSAPRGVEVEAAYFNLPLDFSETGVAVFDELSGDGGAAVLDSAVACADNVLRRIYVEHLFWPPKNRRRTRLMEVTGVDKESEAFAKGYDQWT